MTRQNNYGFGESQRLPHWSLRKLSVGVVSVLLGTTIMLTCSASADVVDHSSTELTGTMQPEGQSNSETAPEAVHAINDQIGHGIMVNSAQVTSVNGDQQQPGSTNLNLQLQLSKDEIQKIKSGDYIDIKLGLQYQNTANGEKQVLSYGRIAPNTAPITLGGQIVAYIEPVDDENTYSATMAKPGSTIINPQWEATQLDNKDQNLSTGGTNGYFRLVFNDYFEKHLDQLELLTKQTLGAKLGWYNPFNGGSLAPLNSASFYLTTDQDGIDSYSPEDDLQIGDDYRSSGVTIKVKKLSDKLNVNQEIGFQSTTVNIAHQWVQRENGEWVLRPLIDPQQSVGIHLSNAAGKEFTINVTKPEDSSTVSFSFASADAIQKELAKYIVAEQKTFPLDQLTSSPNYYITTQTIKDQPKVTVTMDKKGNTASYHVIIAGDYAGFSTTSNGSTMTDAPLSLINWTPKDVADLLPVQGISNKSEDMGSGNVHYENDETGHYYGGCNIRGTELQNYLDGHPWEVQVVTSAGQDIFNKKHGYWIDAEEDWTNKLPDNSGIAVNDQVKTIRQVIHFVDQKGNPVAGDIVRTVTFISRDGTHFYNFTNPKQDNDPVGHLAAIDVPMITNHEAYLAAVDVNGQLKMDIDHRIELSGNPITKAGAEEGFTADHGNFTLYVVYKNVGQNANYEFSAGKSIYIFQNDASFSALQEGVAYDLKELPAAMRLSQINYDESANAKKSTTNPWHKVPTDAKFTFYGEPVDTSKIGWQANHKMTITFADGSVTDPFEVDFLVLKTPVQLASEVPEGYRFDNQDGALLIADYGAGPGYVHKMKWLKIPHTNTAGAKTGEAIFMYDTDEYVKDTNGKRIKVAHPAFTYLATHKLNYYRMTANKMSVDKSDGSWKPQVVHGERATAVVKRSTAGQVLDMKFVDNKTGAVREAITLNTQGHLIDAEGHDALSATANTLELNAGDTELSADQLHQLVNTQLFDTFGMNYMVLPGDLNVDEHSGQVTGDVKVKLANLDFTVPVHNSFVVLPTIDLTTTGHDISKGNPSGEAPNEDHHDEKITIPSVSTTDDNEVAPNFGDESSSEISDAPETEKEHFDDSTTVNNQIAGVNQQGFPEERVVDDTALNVTTEVLKEADVRKHEAIGQAPCAQPINQKRSSKQLPQTGNYQEWWGLSFGFFLMVGLSAIGIDQRHHKNSLN